MPGFRPEPDWSDRLVMSVDRGRAEVSAIWSEWRDQPIADVGYGSRAAVAGRLMAHSRRTPSFGNNPSIPGLTFRASSGLGTFAIATVAHPFLAMTTCATTDCKPLWK
jgi:hypothetical protein